MGRDLLAIFKREIEGLKNSLAVGALEGQPLIAIHYFYEMISTFKSGLESFKFISSDLRNILIKKNIKVKERGVNWFVDFKDL